MNYNHTQEIYRALQLELEKETGQGHLLDELSEAIAKIRLKIKELEAHIQSDPLLDISQQVLLFKKVYPLFISELIYYSELYNLERSLQRLDETEWVTFLKEEQNEISHFFKKNNFLYEYYKLGLSELDQVYFSEQGGTKSHLLSELPAVELNTNSLSSHTLARIMALERLRSVIGDKLTRLSPPGEAPGGLGANKSRLKWTGEAINLVEVAYGFWLTGQINHGNASINEVIQFLEAHLDVKIGRPYRRWTEVARRKTLSPTKFIDQMRLAIEKRIDDENSLG